MPVFIIDEFTDVRIHGINLNTNQSTATIQADGTWEVRTKYNGFTQIAIARTRDEAIVYVCKNLAVYQ